MMSNFLGGDFCDYIAGENEVFHLYVKLINM